MMLLQPARDFLGVLSMHKCGSLTLNFHDEGSCKTRSLPDMPVIQGYPLFRSSILSYITHMPLFFGTKLGPNEILALIGAGGIGGTRPETRDVALRVREIL